MQGSRRLRFRGGRVKSQDLTPKEHEVFKYLAEGKNYSDIAMILGVTSHCVRSRVFEGVARVGAETRDHAIALLIKSGKL